jgi:hypothetical protein
MYDVLEKCLLEIEQGADVDTVLFRYPEFADELRPILETSIKAKDMAVPAPSADIVRRNRAKILQHAAEMREAKVKPASRIWIASLRRLAVTLTVVLMLFVGGTGLVRAASNTIPGDDLYPVKRTWEDVLVLFTFNVQEREQLEFEHENERLDELDELFAEGRSVDVDFAGYVTRQSGSVWRVSGISVVTSPQTDLPDETVTIGAAVRIVGVTQSDGTVLAERIELLPAGSKLPEVEDDEPEIEQENSNGSDQPGEGESGSRSENEAPQVEVTETPEAEVQPKQESFEGTLESIDSKNNIWTVDGKKLDVSTAEITGTPVIGAAVKGEGYLDPNGIFVVTKIEIVDSGSGGSNDNVNSNDNSNDDDSNDDNSNDNDGGDD